MKFYDLESEIETETLNLGSKNSWVDKIKTSDLNDDICFAIGSKKNVEIRLRVCLFVLIAFMPRMSTKDIFQIMESILHEIFEI